jgi:hypothetical protein
MRSFNLLWPALLAQTAASLTVDTTSSGRHDILYPAIFGKTNHGR